MNIYWHININVKRRHKYFIVKESVFIFVNLNLRIIKIMIISILLTLLSSNGHWFKAHRFWIFIWLNFSWLLSQYYRQISKYFHYWFQRTLSTLLLISKNIYNIILIISRYLLIFYWYLIDEDIFTISFRFSRYFTDIWKKYLLYQYPWWYFKKRILLQYYW